MKLNIQKSIFGIVSCLALSNVFAAGTMMQAFYWDIPQGLWTKLDKQLPELKQSGITAIWIPMPTKGAAGGYSMGYDPYDLYDFGEYDQRGSVATRFGTKAELKKLIEDAHKINMQVYVDVVLNHMDGGNEEVINGKKLWTKFSYPHHQWERSHHDFLDHNVSICPSCGENSFCNDWGSRVNYTNGYNYRNLMKWADYINTEYRFDGYRFDAGKCVFPWVFVDFMKHNEGKFAVSEVYDGNVDYVKSFIHMYEGRVQLFDFPLAFMFHEMTNGKGFFDMRKLVNAGLQGVEPRYAVTFVTNHDLDRSMPIPQHKEMAYAYIMTHDGYPTVFYKDYEVYGMKKEISELTDFHNQHAHGPIKVLYADQDVYAMARDDFILIMNDNEMTGKDIGNIQLPFRNVTLINKKLNITVQVDLNGYAVNYKLWAPKAGYAIWEIK